MAGVGGEGKGRGDPDSWSHSAQGKPVFMDPTGDKTEGRRKTTRGREVGLHGIKERPWTWESVTSGLHTQMDPSDLPERRPVVSSL